MGKVIIKSKAYTICLEFYVKPKKKSKVESWAMEHLVDYFQCSTREVEDHLELLTKEQVTTIIMKYGVEDKQLKKIWSN